MELFEALCLHSHHLLLGVLEALGDEVERLVLGDGVLGHARLLGVETLQLGLAWEIIREVVFSSQCSAPGHLRGTTPAPRRRRGGPPRTPSAPRAVE